MASPPYPPPSSAFKVLIFVFKIPITVPDATVEFLLHHLKDLLDDHPKMITDAREPIEHLCKDLTLFITSAKEYIEKPNPTFLEREFVKRVMKLIYRSEDSLDKYVSRTLVHQSRNQFMKAIHAFHHAAIVRKLISDIESISRETKSILDIKSKIESVRIANGTTTFCEKASVIVEEDNVVGFEDEASEIINLVNGGSNELQVISITGMPGIGKTTLAKLIYCHREIKDKFCNRAWVYVSESYKRNEVLLTILNQFTQLNDEMDRMTDENLGSELYKFLEDKKYLIVIDDVWTEDVWNDLEHILPKNKQHSRILLTSRIWSVAKHANSQRDPHKLRLLSREESWMLLEKKALCSKVCPSGLKRHGMHIVDQCKGLRLSLVVIGARLLERGTESYWWEKIAHHVNTYLSSDPRLRMERSVARSFNQLPYHLKQCFSYFGMFPRDFQFSKQELIRLWIAEGFVCRNTKMRLEDIAEQYLEDLVNMNLVMVGKRGSNNAIKTCQVHDMLHEFCKKKAEDENYLFSDRNAIATILAEVRRVCIHYDILNFISLIKKFSPGVRTLLMCFSSKGILLKPEQISIIVEAFELLRVLSIRPHSLDHFPFDITRLNHLRYVVLCGNFKILPAAFSDLWNMQTLVIETSSHVLVIEANIWKMTQLRHVITNASASLPLHLFARTRINNCDSNLQTLSTIAPASCTEEVFSWACNLKKLGIRGRISELLEVKCLRKLDYVENLKLLSDVYPYPPFDGKLISLPEVDAFPPNLKKLTISGTLLDWDHMFILGLLENLEILKLRDDSFTGEKWQTHDGGFRNLKYLYVGRTNLVTWKTSAHHFPRLTSLYLNQCTKLKAVPLCLAHIEQLQIMDLFYTTKSAAASARRIQQLKKRNKEDGFKLSIYPPK